MSEQIERGFEPFWVIWNPEGRNPAFKHTSPVEARAEAQRLARLNPGQEFYILRAESKCKLAEFQWEEAGEYIPF